MNVPAITMLIWFGLAATAAAQGTPSGKAASSGAPSKTQLSEVRTLVHELQGRTEKLRDLMEQYRSLAEQRPQEKEQQAKWDAAVERLMRRVDVARAAVVETTQQLDKSVTGQLPTALAKDVASAKNEADAQRTAAEQALAKNKPARTPKPAKTAAAEKPAPPIPDDL